LADQIAARKLKKAASGGDGAPAPPKAAPAAKAGGAPPSLAEMLEAKFKAGVSLKKAEPGNRPPPKEEASAPSSGGSMMDELQNRLKKRTSSAPKPAEPQPPSAEQDAPPVPVMPALKKAPAKTTPVAPKAVDPAPAAAGPVPAWKQRAQAAKEPPKETYEEVVESDMAKLSRIMGAPIESEEEVCLLLWLLFCSYFLWSKIEFMQEGDIPATTALPDKLWARKYLQSFKKTSSASSRASPPVVPVAEPVAPSFKLKSASKAAPPPPVVAEPAPPQTAPKKAVLKTAAKAVETDHEKFCRLLKAPPNKVRKKRQFCLFLKMFFVC
jgi:hypothetical protein